MVLRCGLLVMVGVVVVIAVWVIVVLGVWITVAMGYQLLWLLRCGLL